MGLNKTDLMPGLWQQLLPHALALTDEISKHGGIANPFFTFGGGTVLMLRYQHRFSKDIDIFVPDPQSLNYVNPRLSDVAEEMCNAQYIEAANFVKLVLEEGEIDFVASPNLLPDDSAYELWELCGREVRVETAAEIIAKKMYHRGAMTTARDLFDLAMVIEHEPDALIDAIPFMHRHLDTFLKHIRAPSTNFVTQFNSIQRINYDPTFEDAARRTVRYLEQLQC